MPSLDTLTDGRSRRHRGSGTGTLDTAIIVDPQPGSRLAPDLCMQFMEPLERRTVPQR